MESRLQLLGESLDALPVNVSVVDDEGTIVQTNRAWREFGRRNDIGIDPDTIGTNYLDVCEQSATETATETRRGLAELLAGRRDSFQLEYPCHSPVEQRWFLLVAVPVTIEGRRHAVVAHSNVTEYKLAARQRDREVAHLEALTDLSAAIREVTHAVIDQSSRSEIDATVCTALVETTGYDCAWVGEVIDRGGSLTVRATAGDCPDGLDADDTFEGLFGEAAVRQAIWTHEVQTTNEIHEDPAFDWRGESGEAYTKQAVAAVPVTHRGTLYGVCAVYTDRSTAFGPDERAILAQLGAVVGHAIAASERTLALMSDELIEIDLRVPTRFEQPRSAADWQVEITQTVAADGDYVVYGTTTDADLDGLRAAVDPADAELTVIGGPPESIRVAIRLAGECVISLLAAHGWSTDTAVVDSGDWFLTVHLPTSDSVRELMDIVREANPGAELLTRRQIHAEPVDADHETPVAELTERQRTVLKTAHAAGYFEWPREASGEEIAATLGISAPTFHQHLRLGEGKLMDAVLSEEAVGG